MNPTVPLEAGIPEALKKLHAFRSFNPPDPAACSWTITAKSGKGKTTLLASWPNALLLDLEGGSFLVPQKDAWCVYCPVWSEAELTPQMKNPPPATGRPPAVALQTVVDVIKDMAKKPDCPIRTIVIDSAEFLQGILTANLEKTWQESAGERGQSAWRDINRACSAFIRQFQNLGFGVGIAVHLKDEFKDMKSGTQVFTKPTITDGFMEQIKKSTDFTLTIESGQRMNPVTKKSELQYDILTEQNVQRKGNYELKRRIILPPKIENVPLVGGMNRVFDTYRESVENLRKTFGQPVPANP